MNKLERDIINTIAEEGGIDLDCIQQDSDFYDLGVDSLSSLEILAVLEKKYDIRISENDLININSISKIVRLVLSEIDKKKAATISRR
jgi:acyl carrier protein